MLLVVIPMELISAVVPLLLYWTVLDGVGCWRCRCCWLTVCWTLAGVAVVAAAADTTTAAAATTVELGFMMTAVECGTAFYMLRCALVYIDLCDFSYNIYR